MNFQTGKLYWDFAVLFFSCPVLLSFASSSQHCRNCLGKFSHACASRKWKILAVEHRIAVFAVHSPRDLPRHLLQIPRHGNKPRAGEDKVLLRSEAVASKGKSWMQSCFPLPICPRSCFSASGHPIKVPEKATS